MMDGEEAYNESRLIAMEWGILMPDWSEVPADERIQWSVMAYESELADRLTSTTASGTVPA